MSYLPQGSAAMGELWQRLINCDTVREYQAAFSCATNIPLTLVSPSRVTSGPPAMPSRGDCCVQGCLGGNSGHVCWSTLRSAEQRAAEARQPVEFACAAGLVMILAPAMVRNQYLGGLLAGPFAVRSLDPHTLRRLKRELTEQGLTGGAEGLRKVWNHSPTIPPKKRWAVAQMLSLFAQYLSERAEGQLSARAAPVSPILTKVKALLAVQGSEQAVSLRQVAAQVSLSPCHFCRVFKQQTGLTLTEYRVRQRVDRAKQLLLERERRITEVAYEAGFETISHFNHVFRRYVGCSPGEYRRSVMP